jgi:hypothetical protein
MGGYMGTADTAELAGKINGWMSDEVYTYGTDFYK